jgi:adenosylhomocysteine nucleosidase
LGIVVGLAAEARIARNLGMVEIGGGRPPGAEAAAERLLARGAKALVSFGLAGGLDPALRAGHLVVPTTVLEGDVRYAACEVLTRRFGGATVAMLLAGDTVVVDSDHKHRLAAATGASAVDLESGAVARAAARHGVPFAVLRAVCDPVDRTLPPAALMVLDDAGNIGGLRVARTLLSRPKEFLALIGLAVDAARARRTLMRATGLLDGFVTP